MRPDPKEVARGMLNKYSSPKVALDMAFWHEKDYRSGSPQRQHWANVQREIMAQANVGPDGNPKVPHGT